MEDEQLSDIERTKRAIGPSMDGIMDCLSLTVESEEDHANGWLPTLDLNLQVDSDNSINYKFFEKPTASKMCLQSDTAENDQQWTQRPEGTSSVG